MGIVQGPSHMEVMYNETTGPCLVEVGSRCQGGEGTWLPTCVECVGYTQVILRSCSSSPEVELLLTVMVSCLFSIGEHNFGCISGR